MPIEAVNALSDADFAAHFGDVLEDSPHLAARVAAQRPFEGLDDLADAFVAVVDSLDADQAVALIRAHPELGSQRPMTAASVDEQSSAGVRAADEVRRARLAAGNEAYRRRFGFPFVVSVRGLTPDQILHELDTRLGHDQDVEVATALGQIGRIARLRLALLVDPA